MGCCVPFRVKNFYGKNLTFNAQVSAYTYLIGSFIVCRCDWSSEPPEEKKKKVFLQHQRRLLSNASPTVVYPVTSLSFTSLSSRYKKSNRKRVGNLIGVYLDYPLILY